MTQPLDIYLGPAAGIATSILWTATSLSFTAAARRIGATLVNSLRIFMAAVLLGITHRLIFHTWVPHAADSQQIVFLAISGLLGLSIGDQALFISYVDIGPRLAMLVMATSPILAALFAWAALGEELGHPGRQAAPLTQLLPGLHGLPELNLRLTTLTSVGRGSRRRPAILVISPRTSRWRLARRQWSTRSEVAVR